MKETKPMTKFFLWVLAGVAAVLVFLYFGGGKYVAELGRGTESFGQKLQTYEKPIREKTQGAAETASKAVKKTKDVVKKAAE